MSTKLSSATALHEVRAASAATATGVSKGGPTETVGSTVIANAQAGSDRILYYVKGPADPVVADRGNAIASSGPLYQAEPTDVAVTVPEGTGDQTWVYVKAGAAIARGDICLLATGGDYEGVTVAAGAESASLVAGVAQHNIPDGSFGWLLVKGAGIASCGASVLVNGEVIVGAGGDLANLASGKGIGLGLIAGAGIHPVILDI